MHTEMAPSSLSLSLPSPSPSPSPSSSSPSTSLPTAAETNDAAISDLSSSMESDGDVGALPNHSTSSQNLPSDAPGGSLHARSLQRSLSVKVGSCFGTSRATMRRTRSAHLEQKESLRLSSSSGIAVASPAAGDDSTHPTPQQPLPIVRRLSLHALTLLDLTNNEKAEQDTVQYEAMMQRLQLRRFSDDQNVSKHSQDVPPVPGEGDEETFGDSLRMRNKPTMTATIGEQQTLAKGTASDTLASTKTDVQRRTISQRHRLKRKARRCLRRFFAPIIPGDPFSRVYSLVMALVMVLQLVYLPIPLAYLPHGESQNVTCINLLLEFIMLIDVVVRFNTAFYDQKGFLVTSHREIAWNYLRSWLVVDCVSSIPVDWIMVVFQHHRIDTSHWSHVIVDVIARLPRAIHVKTFFRACWLFRSYHHHRVVSLWCSYSKLTHLLSIFKLIFLVLLSAHYMTCGWHLVAINDPMFDANAAPDRSTADQYVADYYIIMMLLQGQGQSIGSTRVNLYSILIILFGSIIVVLLLGNVTMLVATYNVNATKYQQKMEEVFATTSKLNLPPQLRERIHQYYDHLFRQYESSDGDLVKFSRELTGTLALEVNLYKYMNFVISVPYWHDCSPDFVTQMLMHMVVRVYLPDDYVVRRGEVGDEMFMINRGVCEVTDIVGDATWGKTKGEERNSWITARTTSLMGVASQPLHPTSDQLDYLYRVDDNVSESAFTNSNRDVLLRKPSQPSRDVRRLDRIQPMTEPSTSAPPRATKTTCRLTPGDVFGELALIMNCKHTASVRAVTHVEMCIVTRRAFQQIIARHRQDRELVLERMLVNAMECKLFPLSDHELCNYLLSLNDMEHTYDHYLAMTHEERAQVLVDRMDANVIDESIRFGFQDLSVETKSIKSPRSPVTPPPNSTGKIPIPQDPSARINAPYVPNVVQLPTTTSQDHEKTSSPANLDIASLIQRLEAAEDCERKWRQREDEMQDALLRRLDVYLSDRERKLERHLEQTLALVIDSIATKTSSTVLTPSGSTKTALPHAGSVHETSTPVAALRRTRSPSMEQSDLESLQMDQATRAIKTKHQQSPPVMPPGARPISSLSDATGLIKSASTVVVKPDGSTKRMVLDHRRSSPMQATVDHQEPPRPLRRAGSTGVLTLSNPPKYYSGGTNTSVTGSSDHPTLADCLWMPNKSFHARKKDLKEAREHGAVSRLY